MKQAVEAINFSSFHGNLHIQLKFKSNKNSHAFLLGSSSIYPIISVFIDALEGWAPPKIGIETIKNTSNDVWKDGAVHVCVVDARHIGG